MLDQLNNGPTRDVECFKYLKMIGEGTDGFVCKAREKKTGEIVALKRLLHCTAEKLPEGVIQEITIMKNLNNPNVIKLKEIVTSVVEGNMIDANIYLVFEYMDHDLAGLTQSYGPTFTVSQIKCYMKQLLKGLQYCHTQNILHRDIKGANLLVNNEGTLKIADFGLARLLSFEANVNLTNRVVTLWWRPPELLLGSERYGPSVDMWSVGCVFAELFYGKPILKGETEAEQIKMIFELCGSPDETEWPNVSKLPLYKLYKPEAPMERRVRERFKNFASDALDLLDNLLTLDPSKRMTALEAQYHDYFNNEPRACDPESLPTYESSHLYTMTKKRKQPD